MSRTNKILAALLALQFVLLGVRAVWPSSSNNKIAPGGVLVANYDPATVNQITVTDDSGKTITLKQTDGNWILPDYGDYPVEASRIMTVLDKIQLIRADRLITQSETSFRQLKVSPDEYVRLVEFDQTDGKSHKLYLGKTGGGNTVHVRLDDQNQVFLTSDLTPSDVNATPAGWIDTTYYTASTDDVVSITLQNANGTFDFTKDDGGNWTVSGLNAGEILKQVNFTPILNTITALRMTQPISTEVQDSFGMDAPQAVITLHVMETEAPETSNAAPAPDTSGLLGVSPETTTPTDTPAPTATPQKVEKEYTFQIGAALDNGVVLKGTNSDYYVLVAQSTADHFTNKSQSDFATVPPTPTPGPTMTPVPATETPVPMSVPPTPEATIAPTEEPTQAATTPEPTIAPTEEPTQAAATLEPTVARTEPPTATPTSG
jgi:hypothetical protein